MSLVQSDVDNDVWRWTGRTWVKSGEESSLLRIGTYYCCQKAVGTGETMCPDCRATLLPKARLIDDEM